MFTNYDNQTFVNVPASFPKEPILLRETNENNKLNVYYFEFEI